MIRSVSSLVTFQESWVSTVIASIVSLRLFVTSFRQTQTLPPRNNSRSEHWAALPGAKIWSNHFWNEDEARETETEETRDTPERRMGLIRHKHCSHLGTSIRYPSQVFCGDLFWFKRFREKTRFNNIFWSDNFMLRDKAEIYLEFLKTRNILSSIKRKSNKPAGSYYVQF